MAGNALTNRSTAQPAELLSAPRMSTIITLAFAASAITFFPFADKPTKSKPPAVIAEIPTATTPGEGVVRKSRGAGCTVGTESSTIRVTGSRSTASMPCTAVRYSACVFAASTFGIAATSAASQSRSL